MVDILSPRDGITLHNVAKFFPGAAKPAVTDVSATLHSGCVTGLIGPDGAGKTTLLRMLCGLLKPSQGSLRVKGLDPVSQSRQLHSITGYMPQNFGLYEDLSVIENLNLYAELRGVNAEERRQIFQRLLTLTNLTSFTERLAGKLSGGMKQKLGLACTLLGQPEVLLLDEPGVGVDPISRQELWQMIHELANEGMIILWSTSNLEEVEQCSEVLLMNQGKLLFSGKPHELIERISGRSFLLHLPDGNNRLFFQKILSLPQISDGALQGKYIRLILKKECDSAAFFNQLAATTAKISAVQPRFEDAFIDLLGGRAEPQLTLSNISPYVPEAANEIVIEARQLTKKFGDFIAANNVSFQVKRGEIFGLLGPNGAGKSTTFKIMCGLLSPSSGQALVSRHDLQKNPTLAHQQLGYMAQKYSLYGNLTVMQNLKFFSGIYGLSGKKQRAKIQEMITTLHLDPFLDQASETLPPGFRQRLALACCLMHEPAVLFLDEPTSGVDPLTRREFWSHINGMVNQGVTVMVTTHFMEEAEYCDRISLVYRGKIIAEGTPDALKEKIATSTRPEPTIEQVFFSLIQEYDQGKMADENVA